MKQIIYSNNIQLFLLSLIVTLFLHIDAFQSIHHHSPPQQQQQQQRQQFNNNKGLNLEKILNNGPENLLEQSKFYYQKLLPVNNEFISPKQQQQQSKLYRPRLTNKNDLLFDDDIGQFTNPQPVPVAAVATTATDRFKFYPNHDNGLPFDENRLSLFRKYKPMNLVKSSNFNDENEDEDDELNRLLISSLQRQQQQQQRNRQRQQPLNFDYPNSNDNKNEQLIDLMEILGQEYNNQQQSKQSITNDRMFINDDNVESNDNDDYGNLNNYGLSYDTNQKWKLKEAPPLSILVNSNRQQPLKQHSLNHQPIFREENMAIPYDEIEHQQINMKKSTFKGNNDEIMNRNSNDDVDQSSSIAAKKRILQQQQNQLTRQQIPSLSSNIIKSEHSIRAALQEPYKQQQLLNIHNTSKYHNLSDLYFIAIVACVSTIAIFSVIGAGYCFYKVQQSNKQAADVDFPTYGIIGPVSRKEFTDSNNAGLNNNSTIDDQQQNKCQSPSPSLSNDRKLVQSAQIYHYHHQKQQMISTEKNSTASKNNMIGSDIESDEENEDGEYTVYECPGLAPTGEMEIKNPLFQDDLTPMSSPSINETSKNDKNQHEKKQQQQSSSSSAAISTNQQEQQQQKQQQQQQPKQSTTTGKTE